MLTERGPRKLCKRFDTPWDAHELTFSCYRRLQLLSRDRTREYFAQAVNRAAQQHAFDVWAYVIMPEHVHLLLWPKRADYSVSAILKSIKQSVSRKAIGYLRSNDPRSLALLATGQKNCPYRFWLDGGGYDRNIRAHPILRSVIDYIHNNPIRRGLVAQPGDWLWSSFSDWTGDGQGPVALGKESCLRSM